MDTGALMPIPRLPLATDHNAPYLVPFHLGSALYRVRVLLGMTLTLSHVDPWLGNCMERHVLRAVRSAAPQAPLLTHFLIPEKSCF